MPAVSSNLARRRAAALMAGLVAAGLVAACGAAPVPASTESTKSALQVVRDAATAIENVDSFRIAGTVTAKGVPSVAFDMKVEGSDAMTGTLTLLGATGHFVTIDGDAYMQGEDFFAEADGAAAAAKLGNSWVALTPTNAASFVAGFSGFTDLSTLATCLITSASTTKLSKSVTTLNGASVVAVKGGETTLDIANSGTPYPLRMVVSGPGDGLLTSTAACAPSGSTSADDAASFGTITFSDWGNQFSVAAPQTFIAAPTPTAVPSPAPVLYHDPQGRWSAVFPLTPTYTATSEPTAEGNVPYLFAEYVSFDVDEFVGDWLLKPESTFNLSAAFSGIAKGLSGTVVSGASKEFRGYQAYEGVVLSTAGYLKAWLVRSGAVVYVIATVGPDNPPSDFAGFVNSVKLTPH
jgi:hypothetical protein